MEYVVRARFDDGPREHRSASAVEAYQAASSYEKLNPESVTVAAPNGSLYSVRDFYRAMSSGVMPND